MNQPKLVSVIMSNYNDELYIRRAIDSILTQTYTNLELVVVDDASTDNSREVIEAVEDARVISIYLSENQGYPNALNRAIEHASGDYIARMDSDDISMPERVEKQVQFLDAHPDIPFVGTTGMHLTPRGKLFPVKHDVPTERLREANTWIYEDWDTVFNIQRYFLDSSVMFRKACAQQVGNYRVYQRSGQDTDLWLRLLETYPIAATLNEPLYHVYMKRNSVTEKNAKYNRYVRHLARERKQHGTDRVMRGDSVVIPDEVKQHQSSTFYIWKRVEICLRAGDYATGISWAFSAFRIKNQLRRNLKLMLQMTKRLISTGRRS